MFMDIYVPSENSLWHNKIFPVLLKCDFSWFQPIVGRFYKMHVFLENLTFTTFLSPFINALLYFHDTDISLLWISKYNARRWRLVQNKTFTV